MREWTPALRAAGFKHRRIYDLRHTYATWSLAAGISVFSLSRRMGTSLGHDRRDLRAPCRRRGEGGARLLDAYDATFGQLSDTAVDEE
jgi:integrase